MFGWIQDYEEIEMNEALVTTDSQKSPQLVSGQSTTRKKPSLGKKVWRFFQGNPPALIGGSILVVMVLACLFAPLLTSYDPERRVARPHQAPSAKHLMGTTRSGRDIFSQALHGGRISLSVAFGSCLLYTSPSPRDGLLSRMPSSA